MRLVSMFCVMTLACLSVLHPKAEPAPVAFNSFEYTGILPGGNPTPGEGEYGNPILAGFYPDPSICRVGGDYYLVNSTFAYYPGIPIFHSTDLINWTQIGNVIDRPGMLNYDIESISLGIFAPAISHHDGTFYVICTMVGTDGNFVVTATDPAGPWSDPVRLPFGGIDPSIYFEEGHDEDGRAWIVHNAPPEGQPLYNGHTAIWLQEFDYHAMKMTGPRKVVVNGGVDISKHPIWIEGPHLYRRGEWYYLMAAEGGTEAGHSEVIFRSRNVDGPYQPWDGNPILTQRGLSPSFPGAVTCTGHADMVEGPGGNWWAVFLGMRPYAGHATSPMGRETFMLPVTWTEDGWPLILPPGERVPLVARSPGGASLRPDAALPLSGAFTWRDDFDGGTLSPLWVMLRAPKETWWKLNPGTHSLELTPRAERLSGKGNPSFMGRRIQHSRFSATTELVVPRETGVIAGLAAHQNKTAYYFMGVRNLGDQLEITLEQAANAPPQVIQRAAVPFAETVALRMIVRTDTCSFEYRAGEGDWQELVTGADAKLLTTELAGGFVGATVGMYAVLDGEKQ